MNIDIDIDIDIDKFYENFKEKYTNSLSKVLFTKDDLKLFDGEDIEFMAQIIENNTEENKKKNL